MQTELEVIESSELAVVIRENQIEAADAQSLLAAFQPSFMAAKDLVDKAAGIIVTDATQVSEIKASRALRLKLREVRIEAEKTRKKLKEDSLRRGKAIDGMNNILLMLVKPTEDRLEEQEKFAERKEAERKSKLAASRSELLAPFGVDASFYNLGDMPEATFSQLFESSRLAHESRVEAARKAEADRIAAEAARVAEEASIREENERMRKEAEEREAAIAAERKKAEQERLAAEAKAKAEREAADRGRIAAEKKAKAEREAIEAKARKEREALEAKAAAERKAREQVEAELQAKRQAEEAARLAEAEAERLAATAPDHEKLVAFAATIGGLSVPSVSSPEAKIVANAIAAKVKAMAKWVKDQADSIR